MLDKSVPYYDIPMHRLAGMPIPKYCLPHEFIFSHFSPGDDLAWAEIEASVDEFPSSEAALTYFRKEYLTCPEEVKRRTIFIQAPNGEKVATFTIWWNYTDQLRVPSVHWVAVKPQFQGQGLGKAVVFKGMELSIAVEGDRDIYLHTQTWSHRAVAVYHQAGFRFITSGSFGGYKNDLQLALPILQAKLRPDIFSRYCEPLWQKNSSY